MTDQRKANKRVTRMLFLTVLGMFAFGFAMVPLYRLVCEVGGLNGVANNTGRVLEADLGYKQDTSRTITVQFDATVNTGLPWEFHPKVRAVEVHPGETRVISYIARNVSDKPITGQAIPGITPWQATQYFHKIECFCFTQQTLAAGEEKEMPVRFVIDPQLSKEYSTVTLSYSFMNTDRNWSRTTPQQATLITGERPGSAL